MIHAPRHWQSRSVRAAVLLLLLTLIVPVVGAGSASAASWEAVASDGFERSVTSGWGSAPTGGPYSLSVPSGATASVSGGNAVAAGLQSGSRFVANLPVAGVDTRVKSAVTPAGPADLDLSHTWRLRQNASGSSYYAVSYRAIPNGNVLLFVSRFDNGNEVWLSGTRLSARAVIGSKLWLEARVTGTTAVTIEARAWLDGNATPSWQLTHADTTSGRISASGRVALDDYVSAASSPATLRHDILLVETSAGGASAPAPAPAPAPQPVAQTMSARGATLGSTSYSYPSSAVFVSPSGNDASSGTIGAPLRTVGAALRKVSNGSTIVLRQGSYHESVTVPADKSITIQNYPQEVAWFDGSVPVTNWAKSGTAWVASGWTKSFSSSMGGDAAFRARFLNPAYPMANRPDQVFVDGAQLRQVGSASAVTAGTFYVDEGADKLYVGTDPSGHDVRASDLEQAIRVLSPNTTLQGFGVRRYGTPYEVRGAILSDAAGGTFRQLAIQDNATIGLVVSKYDKVVDRTTVKGNGMLGINADHADRLKVRNSVLSSNNAENFKFAPVSGGIKVTETPGVLIENNEVRSNGPGLGIWLDLYCSNFKIVGNTSVDNGSEQIEIEMSSTGIVANNTTSGGTTGIRVYNSDKVKIFNNETGGHATFGVELTQDARWQTLSRPGFPVTDKDIVVSNNVFGCGKLFQFYALDKETRIPADNMAITINGNLFSKRVVTTDPSMVAWGQGDNVTLSRYETPAALSSAKSSSWRNAQSASCVPLAQMDSVIAASQSTAVPLPSDVASSLNVATGTVKLGNLG